MSLNQLQLCVMGTGVFCRKYYAYRQLLLRPRADGVSYDSVQAIPDAKAKPASKARVKTNSSSEKSEVKLTKRKSASKTKSLPPNDPERKRNQGAVAQLSEFEIFKTFWLASIYCSGKIVLRFCDALHPSCASLLINGTDNILSSVYTEITLSQQDNEYRACRASIVEELQTDSKRFMVQLDKNQQGSGRFAKLSKHVKQTSEVMEQATGVVDNVSNMADTFFQLAEKAEGSTSPRFVLTCNDIAMHAPVVGIMFAILKPILLTFVESNETNEKVGETSRRIGQLIKELNGILGQTEEEDLYFTAREIEEIDALLQAIKDGFDIVGKVLQGRQSWLGRLLNVEDHKAKLEGWLSATQQMLESDQRNNVRMISYRTRFIVETQRRYFAFLTFMSVVNIVVCLVVLYFVLEILNAIKADPPILRWTKRVLVYGKKGSEKMKLDRVIKWLKVKMT